VFLCFGVIFILVFGIGVIVGNRLDQGNNLREIVFEGNQKEYEGNKVLQSDVNNKKAFILRDETVVGSKNDLDTSEDKNPSDNDDSKKVSNSKKVNQNTGKLDKVISEKDYNGEKKFTEKPFSAKPIQNKSVSQINNEKRELALKDQNEFSKYDNVNLPPVDPNGQYTVQLGAFKEEAEAKKLEDFIKQKGYPVFIKQIQIRGGKPWYKVRVGTFDTKEKANKYAENLKKAEPDIKLVFVTINN